MRSYRYYSQSPPEKLGRLATAELPAAGLPSLKSTDPATNIVREE
jgi:hypothetical protein